MSRIVMAFGTFDVFHPGHEYYLSEAKKLADSLVVVIARDTTVHKVKGTPPRNDEQSRQQAVIQSGIADEVVLGDQDNPYLVIQKYLPDILCFGYDQRSFNDERLESFLKSTHLNPGIVTIPPFEPEKWKSSKMGI